MPTMMGRGFFLALCLVMHPFMLLIHANDEGNALKAFKNALNDPHNFLQNWYPNSANPCSWSRVKCDKSNNVIRVELENCYLSGTLVIQLGNLKKLKYLELYNNYLTGSIPAELGNLTELMSLDLNNNKLTGFVPKTLGNLRNLRFLRLNNNKLHGCFPPSVMDLVGAGTLVTIEIQHNNGLCATGTPKCPCPK